MIFSETIGNIQSEEQFNRLALEGFRYQLQRNQVYAEFVDALGIHASTVTHFSRIPFLPIGFYKTREVYAAEEAPSVTFRSSGTTGMQRSTHAVADTSLYRSSLLEGFRHFYGEPSRYLICALTPSHEMVTESSLAYMIDAWINSGAQPGSGFYLDEQERLANLLQSAVLSPQSAMPDNKLLTAPCPLPTVLLIGLTYALLDFAERYPQPLPGALIMETGGMKGQRKELIREEVHEILKEAFSVEEVHSEYGMAEMLSQAYSPGNGRFTTPPWMKILIRDPNDPLSISGTGRTGGINIIDLANWYSCPFLATQDLGRLHADGSFEVLGRFDHSDLRGCNLLMSD